MAFRFTPIQKLIFENPGERMKKDFWSDQSVLVLGGGAWGTVLAQLVSTHVRKVTIWMRDEDLVRSVNATRTNEDYASGLTLEKNIKATHELDPAFQEKPLVVIWALPSKIIRQKARELSPHFSGRELIFHATKGIELESLKTTSEILLEELPCRRIGVISGPNLADEIKDGKPAATVIASDFLEVIEAGIELFSSPYFRVYGSKDVVGVEWAGALKNILAIASGALDGLQMGWNARAFLYTRGIAEMSRFAEIFGGKRETFMGLSGFGDVIATCSSTCSRNYQVGKLLGEGKSLETILESTGITAEGVRTTRAVAAYARRQGLHMPITFAVDSLLDGKLSAAQALQALLQSPSSSIWE
jgi:glycerol-3-phosphate dehydrogenase (NAD(P)+)